MANKYLDNEGLLYLWNRLKSYFVHQVEGKGLSTNDLTDTLKEHYDSAYAYSQGTHAPTDAEKNTIVGVKVNGEILPIDSESRTVDVSVPEALSDLDNDMGFITTADIPEGSAASTTTPKMAGTAAIGVELAFARGDHVHPSDINKVDKVDGKGLSANDYTNAEKEKLFAIAEGAQVNVIESVKVNGIVQDVSSKVVDISVPTNTNQLTNGAGYATTAEVAAAVANAAHLKREKVDQLPDASEADENTIYMLPIADASGENRFVEYMFIDGSWEKTGSSDVDLTGYVKDTDFESITNSEIDTVVAS